MMSLTFSKRWFLLPGVILLIVGGLLATVLRGVDISYPVNTWRMDLDDILANVAALILAAGTFLLGLAALKKASDADHRSIRNEHSINGGMGEAVTHHVGEALKDADVELGLWRRVDVLEEGYKDCMERERVWEGERAQLRLDREALRDWLNRRLDETGNGRREVRDGK